MNERPQLSKRAAFFMLASFAIIIMTLMGLGAQIATAFAATLALIIVVGVENISNMLGYVMATDILFSSWLATLAAATNAGLQMAVAAGLMYSIFSRELEAAWGSRRVSINGDMAFGKMLAHCTTWATAYVRSTVMSLIKQQKVDAPEALQIKWHVYTEGGGFQATACYESLVWLKWAVPEATATAYRWVVGLVYSPATA